MSSYEPITGPRCSTPPTPEGSCHPGLLLSLPVLRSLLRLRSPPGRVRTSLPSEISVVSRSPWTPRNFLRPCPARPPRPVLPTSPSPVSWFRGLSGRRRVEWTVHFFPFPISVPPTSLYSPLFLSLFLSSRPRPHLATDVLDETISSQGRRRDSFEGPVARG